MNTASENFDIYEKVKSAPTDYRAELLAAEQELQEKITRAKQGSLKKISVIKTVQLDAEDVGELNIMLTKRHPKSHQIYTFTHDGKKKNVAVFVVVPPLGTDRPTEEREFVKSKQFKDFYNQLLQEKLINLCQTATKKTTFVQSNELGYSFADLKRALMSATETSKLKKHLEKSGCEIIVVEGREERGFEIIRNANVSPQSRGLVDVNTKLDAVLISAVQLR